MITNSLVYEKAYSFAIRIVNAYKFLKDKQEFVLSKQLLRAETSVGANIAEANGAISDSDFLAKISIAYKKYWRLNIGFLYLKIPDIFLLILLMTCMKMLMK